MILMVLPFDIFRSKIFDYFNFEGHSHKEESGEIRKYDIVLLTDRVFSASLSVDLVATLLLFAKEKSTIICCHEIRDEVNIRNFLLSSIRSLYFIVSDGSVGSQ